METRQNQNSIYRQVKEHVSPFLHDNSKVIVQFLFTLFFIVVGTWFILNQRSELAQIKNAMVSARWEWIIFGILLMAIYLLLQGIMYVFSFAATHNQISVSDATILFIRRNLVSVFLPAGGVSSLGFFTGNIERKGIKGSQIHVASIIYGFTGILSVVIIAVPAFIYAIVQGTVGLGEWYALSAIVLLVLSLSYLYHSISEQGVFYSFIKKMFPTTEVFLNDMQSNKIDKKYFLYTVLISLVIEFVGIAHLYVAILALNFTPSIPAAVMGYIISVIFLIVSPLLRGLGAIEVSMAYVMIRFGYNDIAAIAITFLYRFFEFWLPLVAGVLSFFSKINKLLIRVFPAIFLSAVGIINIISVLTPVISGRVVLLRSFLSSEVIEASNYLVLATGFLLLATAVFLIKGLRTACYFAIILCVVSIIGNITKAIDYEEAIVSLIGVIVLVATRKQYYIKSNPKHRNIGLKTSLFTASITLIYGIVGFYFLDKKHFNIDFSVWQSLRYTVQNYFLIGTGELMPLSKFAGRFLLSINISGFLSIVFLIYTFIRTYVPHKNVSEEELALAKDMLKKFGNSSLDFFKASGDKMIFFSESKKAFISYRISGNFAVALENPIAENLDEMKKCISEFDRYCYKSGMKSIFYRVPEESLKIYQQLRKKDLFLGQEGIVDLLTFKLDGGAKKPMRNAINKVIDRGYKTTIHEPPVRDGVLQKIKSVSDEWLNDMHRTEMIFSQGMFDWEELKKQTIITVENPEEKIIAFLNIIPDYVKGEATYDLIRKTSDAPNGIMDYILVELFKYLISKGFTSVNLGFAPMSGLNNPYTFQEKSMKFAYEKIQAFAHYKGLREYKQKFDPKWHNKYLIYQHDYELLQIPVILTNVIKP